MQNARAERMFLLINAVVLLLPFASSLKLAAERNIETYFPDKLNELQFKTQSIPYLICSLERIIRQNSLR